MFDPFDVDCDILPALMLSIQRGLLGSCTTIEGAPHFEKFLHLPVFPRLQQTCNPRSEPHPQAICL
jgi:hypothetical protein